MNSNLRYALWLIAIAFGATLFGYFFVDPGPVNRGTSSPPNTSRRGRVATHSTPTPSTIGAVVHEKTSKPNQELNSKTEVVESNITSDGSDSSNNQKSDLPGKSPENETVSVATTDAEKSINQKIEAVYSLSALANLAKSTPDKIKQVTFVNGANKLEVVLSDGSQTSFTVPEGNAIQGLMNTLVEAGVDVRARNQPPDKIGNFLYSFGPVLVLGGIILFVFLRSRGGGAFGKSKAKSADDQDFEPVDFTEIAGCDEAVKELKRVVKGLTASWVYRFFNAKRPKGVLLIGPPGTGKTLLARAVATASNGTMSIVSGSEFVEMFVGVGSARVKDMVKEAKANFKRTGKPHIIFIDELDAIGAARGGSNSVNRHEEREQTLNQLLVEMDGLTSSEGIIWIAATNRPEILDPALLRPGRFDCQVFVDKPDKAGREKIFEIHTRFKPLAADLSLETLAVKSYGCVGADIELICNRAAMLAAERWANQNQDKISENDEDWSDKARPDMVAVTSGISMAGYAHTTYQPAANSASGKNKQRYTHEILDEDDTAVITLQDFDEAIDFVRYGDARTSRQAGLQEAEKLNTAYHEAGHAIAAEAMPDADPVAKVTIMSRSKALGYVQLIPDVDKYSITDKHLLARIVMAMAGRAAQVEILGVCDTGAENDFQQAVDTARRMVTDWGMSRLGFLAMGARSSMGMRTGYEGGSGIDCGAALKDEIDREWRRIVNECYHFAQRIVKADRDRIEAVVKVLIEKETILKDEWTELMDANPSKVADFAKEFNPLKEESASVNDGSEGGEK